MEKEYVPIPSESSLLDISLEQGQRTPLVLLLTVSLTSLRETDRGTGMCPGQRGVVGKSEVRTQLRHFASLGCNRLTSKMC